MLPLSCVIALDFLFCLVTRVLLDETTKEEGEGPEEATPPPSEEERPTKGVSSFGETDLFPVNSVSPK